MDTQHLLGVVHPLIWISWVIYWNISARGVKAARRDESSLQKMAHFGPLILAALLLGARELPWPLEDTIFPSRLVLYFAGTGVLITGLAFTVWARIVLGRNWSATVAIKHDHELVQSGPYRWVRHPIYTGILLGFIGSAMARDTWAGVLAVALVFTGFWFKLLREEVLMRELFGDRYVEYSRRTTRLVPGLL